MVKTAKISPIGGATVLVHQARHAASSELSTPSDHQGWSAVSGISVAEVLELSSLRTARLVAGASGLHRMVRRLNVMEVPDVLPWVKADELILTTGYPLRQSPTSLTGLVGDLDDRGLAAFAIKLARYIDELPAQMLADADRRGFPVILLPDDVGFDDILNQVLTEILNKQAAALAHSDEVHRAIIATVLAGGGLDEVTAKAATLLSRADVVAIGSEGAILASTSPDSERMAHLAELVKAQPPSRSVVQLGGGATAVVVRITAGDFDHGWLLAARPDAMHANDTVTILERAAAVAALTITQKLAVTAVETRYQSDLVRDLVEGRLDDLERMLDQARWFGWNVQAAMVLTVTTVQAVPDQSPRSRRDDLERFAAAWRAALEGRITGAAVVVVSDQVLTLLPVGQTEEELPIGVGIGRSPVTAAADLLAIVGARVHVDRHGAPPPASTGISRAVASLSELPAAYSQARRAAQVGLQRQIPGAVTSFDSLGVLRLLSLIPDSGELRSYLTEVLGPLVPGASSEHSDLLETLRVLLEANLNVAEAARCLHFHYNTLRYRIGKLERLLGPFMTDSSVRLNVQLALNLVDVLGPS
ncbi:MAG: PucR family transcriptional regulator ligand-binding domain-containing protein [Geodermatophilaceae bacterium]|nr:PucR family transcriptional regulator ligand-binding domain-containing protein [Geodermatophilaceae bacterium]